jgi:hypothetical protein
LDNKKIVAATQASERQYGAGYKLIGKNYATPDLYAKVTGKAKYAEDFRAEGMLVWMEFQPELRQPFPKVFQKTLYFRSVLEAQGEIIRMTHGDHVSVCALFAPLVQPEIEGVMQVDIRQHR